MSISHTIHLKFPKSRVRFEGNDLSFTINHIKSREASVVYFMLHLFDMRGDEITSLNDVSYPYVSDRWVIGSEFSSYTTNFELDEDVVDITSVVQLEMVLIGITSENPLLFNEVMFQEGEFESYHKPFELLDSQLVNISKNIYANIYDMNENFVQVIRPVGNKNFKTDLLLRNECTVLAPHLNNESDIDDPVNIMLEFVNMTEQTIGIQK